MRLQCPIEGSMFRLVNGQCICGLCNSLALIKTKCGDLGRKWAWICGAGYDVLATAAPVGNQHFSNLSAAVAAVGAAVALSRFPGLRVQRRVSPRDKQTNKKTQSEAKCSSKWLPII